MALAFSSCAAAGVLPRRFEQEHNRVSFALKCTCRDGAASSSTTLHTDNYRKTLDALKSRDRRPKRWLGQNYMLNDTINEDIVKAAKIKPGDLVLEIGPGTGSLTDALIRAGAVVIGVEKDLDMVVIASDRFRGNPKVELFHDDILNWDVKTNLKKWKETLQRPSSRLAKVVSNLPFNITTDVIKKFLPMGDVFSNMVLLVQDEAAARFSDDSPSGDEYRPISIFIQFYSDLRYKFKVERANFFPQPPVNGAVVNFKIKDSSRYPDVHSISGFFTMVNSAFSEKRKMLRASLKPLYSSSDVEAALKSNSLLETARPHQLTFDQFLALYKTLSNPTTEEFHHQALPGPGVENVANSTS